jgi:uncharacterized protein involved in exopolysaccharide biosynthesis
VADVLLAPLRFAVGAIKRIDPISKREEAIIQIEKNLEVDAEHDSTVIVLTYDAETAILAQQVLSALVATYRDEHVRLHRTNGARPFFAKQRDALQAQLVAAETNLRDAKNRMGLASIDSRRSTLETRLSSIELNRNSTIQSIASTSARVAALQAHADAMPERMHASTSVMPNTGADALRAQLYSLQIQLSNLENRYRPDHPLVASTRAQVEEARQMLDQEAGSRQVTVDSVNDNQRALLLELAKVQSLLAGFEAQLDELNEQRAAALADLRQLNDFEVEIEELEREATLARTNFYGYADDLEEARINEALDRERIMNATVAQTATLAEKPISPSKMLIGALSLALATAGTTLVVLASEKLDSRVHTEDQVEDILRLPVVASVPEGRVYGASLGARRKA